MEASVSSVSVASSRMEAPDGIDVLTQVAHVDPFQHCIVVVRVGVHANAGATANSPRSTAAVPSNASFFVLLFSNICRLNPDSDYITPLKPKCMDMILRFTIIPVLGLFFPAIPEKSVFGDH